VCKIHSRLPTGDEIGTPCHRQPYILATKHNCTNLPRTLPLPTPTMPPPSKSEANSTILAQFPSGSQPPGTTPAVPDSTTNLLDSTPPQIVRALAQAGPLIHGLNVVLGLLTWTSGNDWLSFFLVVAWWVVCLFGSWIIKFAGNFVPVAIIALAYTFQRAGISLISLSRLMNRHCRDSEDVNTCIAFFNVTGNRYFANEIHFIPYST
jgi:hypothetical protein